MTYKLSLQQQKAVWIMWKEQGKDVYEITESFCLQGYPVMPKQISASVDAWRNRIERRPQ